IKVLNSQEVRFAHVVAGKLHKHWRCGRATSINLWNARSNPNLASGDLRHSVSRGNVRDSQGQSKRELRFVIERRQSSSINEDKTAGESHPTRLVRFHYPESDRQVPHIGIENDILAEKVDVLSQLWIPAQPDLFFICS